MKNTSFARRWTKTSLKRILKEFQAQHYWGFLCIASREFASLWYDHKAEIYELAMQFDANAANHHKDHTHSCLFYTNNNREIRIAFLKHEIARLTKP